jgi:tetratricopeptide (TPR) repeat protein
MAKDPYDPCPCGSGNKLKFCCSDVAHEMEKVERQLAHNQPRMALQSLEKARDAHPDSQYVLTLLAITLINEGRAPEAKKPLARLLKRHPEQPFANGLYAMASLIADGYPESKRAVHRAFKLSTANDPGLVARLAGAVSDKLGAQNRPMAARQHMVLQMRLTEDDERQELFEDLSELDGDTKCPYPLRNVRQPVPITRTPGCEGAERLARRLSAVGCWDEAADALEAAQDPQSVDPGLWFNIGLYRAWDGDHPRAAAAFHRAAAAEPDFDAAVEMETLAQLLEQDEPQHSVPMQLKRFTLRSVSQVLSRLDESPQFQRSSTPDEQDLGPILAGRYYVLSRPLTDRQREGDWSVDSSAIILARLTVFDGDHEAHVPPQAFLVGLDGEETELAETAFLAAVEDLTTPQAAADTPESKPGEAHEAGSIPRHQVPLRWMSYIPPKVPRSVAQHALTEHWERVSHELWPRTPLPALDGKTPDEVRGQPAYRVKLAAAIIALDAFVDTQGAILAIEELRSRMELPPPKPWPVDEHLNLNTMSLLQLMRLPLERLSTEQLEHVSRRAFLVRHRRFVYDVLRHAIDRPNAQQDPVLRLQYLTGLVSVCAETNRMEELFEWIRQGRELAGTQPQAFEQVLHWKLRELGYRLRDPGDPELAPLLQHLWQTYGAKMPQLREMLVMQVEAIGLAPPWERGILTPESAGGESPNWGSAVAAGSGSPGKLWLPGSRD